MSRELDHLHPAFRGRAIELLARLVEAGIPCMIVDTLRTESEHQANLVNGVSWIKRSLHLDGLAIDVAPYETFQLHGSDKLQYDASDPVWKRIGEIGAKCGFTGNSWGGNWSAKKKDWGHFEMPAGLIKENIV